MEYGRFVTLNIDHPMTREIQKTVVPLRDLRYYLEDVELDAIDQANKSFLEEGRKDLIINDYDIIGWAFGLDQSFQKTLETTKSEGTESKRSQTRALIWVRSSGFGITSSGRISRTFIELAILARKPGSRWMRKYGCSKAEGKIVPYRKEAVSEYFEELMERNIPISFLLPTGLLNPVIGKSSSSAEHLDKDTLVSLNLIDEHGEISSLGSSLVSAIERWWITETMIAYRIPIGSIKIKIPLVSLLFILGETNQTMTIDTLAQEFNLDKSEMSLKIKNILLYFRVIRLQFNSNDNTLNILESTSGLFIYDMKELVRNLTSGSLWRQHTPVDIAGIPAQQEEVVLLSLRQKFVNDIVSLVDAGPSRALLLTSPVGWGKTGTLLQVAAELISRGYLIALYKGGEIFSRLPSNSIVICDDIDTLSVGSLKELIRLKENGVLIVATASHENMLSFTESITRLRNYGSSFDYEKIIIKHLNHQDAIRLARNRFGNAVSEADIQRIIQLVSEYGNSPELITFVILRAKSEGLQQALISARFEYTLFRIPIILFRVFRPKTSFDVDLDSEITALLVLEELERIRVSDHHVLKKISKTLVGSQIAPRFYTGLVVDSTIGKRPMVALPRPLIDFIKACRHPDTTSRILRMLHVSGIINEFEFESGLLLCSMIRSVMNRYTSSSGVFIQEVLADATPIEKLELLPYAVRIVSKQIPLLELRNNYYEWLVSGSQESLIEKGVTPQNLSETLNGLSFVVQSANISIDDFRKSIFSMFQIMWKKRTILPVDILKAAYLNLVLTVTQRLASDGLHESAITLLDEGIVLADSTLHRTSEVRLRANKSAILRTLSPALSKESIESATAAIRVATEEITTLDNRSFQAIAYNQLALSFLSHGLIEDAEESAMKALDICNEILVIEHDVPSAPPLEIEKSIGWSHYELALVHLSKGEYDLARAHLREVYEKFPGTGHDIVIYYAMAVEPLLWLMQGNIPRGDELVQIMTLNPKNNPYWSMTGASIAYHYFLLEQSSDDEIKNAVSLNESMAPFFTQQGTFSSAIKVWRVAKDTHLLRRNKQYEQSIALACEFIEMLLGGELSKRPLDLEKARVSLSFVLKEMGIIFQDVDEHQKAAKLFVGAGIYWLPVCGPKESHYLHHVQVSMKQAELDVVDMAGWRFANVEIQLFDKIYVQHDREVNFWVVIQEILTDLKKQLGELKDT